jgi:DNA gyrase subunit A
MNPPTTPPNRVPVNIEDEMKRSYMDYAMSVIIGRALPDVRDGLKPAHRRVLYGMKTMGLSATRGYRKCAKIVGEVMGNFHPHGDASIYDTLVRMAQDFNMRSPLVNGQGNFGSIDGDPPAAMRYTEARLQALGDEMMTDLDKETVDFVPNYDETTEEPTVLPAPFPNLLVNGSAGIAVGMATNIPPHNMREVIDAAIWTIETAQADEPATLSEKQRKLLELVPGPDFPTGGYIVGRHGIQQAYLTGRGMIIMRARVEIEVSKKGDRSSIVITEIPYQVNKARLHAKIGELIRDKRIEGIKEARDESDREGMRLVVELKKDVFPQVVLNQLYHLTDMQATFGVINLAIVNKRPAVLNLKEILQYFIEHRREVVSRRTRYELSRAEAQREIVEGLGMVTTDTDVVIKTIRESKDPDDARKKLLELPLRGLEAFVRRAGRPESEIQAAIERKEYRLSERQAKAILEMRLSRLTGLEQDKLATEYATLSDEIARLSAILASEPLLMDLIVKELEEVQAKYTEPRRTQIVDDEAEIQIEDLIQEEQMVVAISHQGYIKRTPLATYRAQKRGGKGNRGMEAREDDFVNQLFICSTHSFVFFFGTTGKVYVKKVYEIPPAARNAKGRAVVNFIGMEEGERVAAITPVEEFRDGLFITTLTRGGQIKKSPVLDYVNYREKGIIGVKITDDDTLLSAAVTDGTREFLIATRAGKSIRFDEQQVRPMGRNAAGVKAIELDGDDVVVGLGVTEPKLNHVLAVCERGYGKRTPLEDFRAQNRGGKGIILIDASERNGPVVGIALVGPNDEVMLVTDRGQTIRTRADEIRETGRNAQGVKVMSVDEGERVVAIESMSEGRADVDGSIPPPPPGAAEGGNGGGNGVVSFAPPPVPTDAGETGSGEGSDGADS